MLIGSEKIASVLGSSLIGTEIILSTWEALIGSECAHCSLDFEAFLDQLLETSYLGINFKP